MNRTEISASISRLDGTEDIPLPSFMTDQAAGMDLFAAVTDDVIVRAGERVLVPTGIAIELPVGFEAQIRPRSGLAFHHGITLLNSPGTIDADYRGEIKVIMINHGFADYVIRRGDRVAQMVVHSVVRVAWNLRESLGETKRGDGGFGHTG